jgi:hypothetical protein
MPSWNIHMAHVERLVSEHDLRELGIGDLNCFLFGNCLPDVYVGYMVHDVSKKLDYRLTHLADPHGMPEPRHQEFWERFCLPSLADGGKLSEVTLGAWTHLMADASYNHHVNIEIKRQKLEYGDPLRVRKQRDFDLFGHTFELTLVPEVTPLLVEQCAAFPQYAVEEPDVRAGVEVARHIVWNNRPQDAPATAEPDYDLLSAAFFARVFDETQHQIACALTRYAAGKDPYAKAS